MFNKLCCDIPFPFFLELYSKSYFEAGRRLKVRSILDVCEELEAKPDAKIALLGNFYSFATSNALVVV